MKYKIMISLKLGYLYEIWGETVNASKPEDFTTHGHFKTRIEAEKALEDLTESAEGILC